MTIVLSLLLLGATLTRRTNPGPPVQYVSPEDAARVLRVNVNSLYRAIRDKQVPAVNIGREYRIPLEFLGVTPQPIPVYMPNHERVGQLLLDLRW